MRLQSEFEITCECGAQFTTHERETLEGPKIGVPCTLRRLKKDGRIVSVVRGVDSDGRSFTSTTGVNTERDIELKKELK